MSTPNNTDPEVRLNLLLDEFRVEINKSIQEGSFGRKCGIVWAMEQLEDVASSIRGAEIQPDNTGALSSETCERLREIAEDSQGEECERRSEYAVVLTDSLGGGPDTTRAAVSLGQAKDILAWAKGDWRSGHIESRTVIYSPWKEVSDER